MNAYFIHIILLFVVLVRLVRRDIFCVLEFFSCMDLFADSFEESAQRSKYGVNVCIFFFPL